MADQFLTTISLIGKLIANAIQENSIKFESLVFNVPHNASMNTTAELSILKSRERHYTVKQILLVTILVCIHTLYIVHVHVCIHVCKPCSVVVGSGDVHSCSCTLISGRYRDPNIVGEQ